jgi:molybdopterin converting factor small subunit
VTATLRLPRFLSTVANTEKVQTVDGENLEKVLTDLFAREPGLRPHILDEGGQIRAHVSVFVDREQADLETEVRDGAEIQVLQAVSGG